MTTRPGPMYSSGGESQFGDRVQVGLLDQADELCLRRDLGHPGGVVVLVHRYAEAGASGLSLTRTRLRSSRVVSPNVQQHLPLRAAPVEFEQSLRCLRQREAPPEHGLKLASPQERQ